MPFPPEELTGTYVRKTYIRKGGYEAEIKYDEQGRAILERHYTDYFTPKNHSNPHDHTYNWDNGFSQRGGVINYFDGNVPDINKEWYDFNMSERIEKSDDILHISYRP